MNKTHHHMKESLRILCARDGGRHAVAAAIGCNEQTLYQVLRGVKTPKGLERGIGARLQAALDARFPGWSELWQDAKRDGHTPPIYVPLLENAASMGIGSEVLPVDVLDGTHQVDVLGRVIWVWNGKKV